MLSVPYGYRTQCSLPYTNELGRPFCFALQFQSTPATMAIVYCAHVGDRVKPACHIRSTQRVTPLGRPATQLFDQTDVAALVTPCLVNIRRLERHACQPRTGLPIQLHLVGADEPFRHRLLPTLVQIRPVRGKVRTEV